MARPHPLEAITAHHGDGSVTVLWAPRVSESFSVVYARDIPYRLPAGSPIRPAPSTIGPGETVTQVRSHPKPGPDTVVRYAAMDEESGEFTLTSDPHMPIGGPSPSQCCGVMMPTHYLAECPECGLTRQEAAQQLAEHVTPYFPPDAYVTCPSCGYLNQADQQICSRWSCGASLASPDEAD